MIDILQKIAGKAGESLLAHFHHELILTHKTTHQNLVTQADTESQNIIQSHISEYLIKNGVLANDIGFIAEENLSTRLAKHMFVIDPLDGTNNFASGFDYFAVSIAHFYEGVLTDGVIYQPTTGTYFIATKNQGACRIKENTKTPMKIRHTVLKDSVILTYMSSNEGARKQLNSLIDRLSSHTRGIRMLGAATLDMMHFSDPGNSLNININSHLYLWDISAAKLIVEEAGGVITDWKGKKIEPDLTLPKKSYQILVCHPQNLSEIVRIINP